MVKKQTIPLISRLVRVIFPPGHPPPPSAPSSHRCQGQPVGKEPRTVTPSPDGWGNPAGVCCYPARVCSLFNTAGRHLRPDNTHTHTMQMKWVLAASQLIQHEYLINCKQITIAVSGASVCVSVPLYLCHCTHTLSVRCGLSLTTSLLTELKSEHKSLSQQIHKHTLRACLGTSLNSYVKAWRGMWCLWTWASSSTASSAPTG